MPAARERHAVRSAPREAGMLVEGDGAEGGAREQGSGASPSREALQRAEEREAGAAPRGRRADEDRSHLAVS